MKSHHKLRRSVAPLVVALCAWLVLPVQALARTLIRFVHAVPGVGAATVTVDDGTGTHTVGSVRFGQVTPWQSIRSGTFRWTLNDRGKRLATGTATVVEGAYDLIVLDKPSGAALGIYRAQGGKPGTSRIRVIHAAPELGSPQLMIDAHRAAGSLSFTRATPYLDITPGTHSLAAMRPGASTPLAIPTQVRLQPDRAYSAVVVGTRGQRVRVVTLVDRGAPLVRHTRRNRPAAAPAGTSQGATASRTLVVRSGDSLWTIARSLLPPGASQSEVQSKLHELWSRNAARIGTGDPNMIFPGQRLTV